MAAPGRPPLNPLTFEVDQHFKKLAESAPAPVGFEWAAVHFRRYHQACQDGTPTMHFDFKNDDDIVAVYLIAKRVPS